MVFLKCLEGEINPIGKPDVADKLQENVICLAFLNRCSNIAIGPFCIDVAVEVGILAFDDEDVIQKREKWLAHVLQNLVTGLPLFPQAWQLFGFPRLPER